LSLWGKMANLVWQLIKFIETELYLCKRNTFSKKLTKTAPQLPLFWCMYSIILLNQNNITMKKSLAILLLVSFISYTALSQSTNDSLINTLNTDIIPGKVPTYYTPGNIEIATDLQKTITSAINFYEGIQSNKFHIKLAVLDSVQWPSTWVPYGFVFYSDGWIFMNTGMDYGNFKKVYGLGKIYTHLDTELKNQKVTNAKMIESFYKVYAIHELGHYFISRLSNAKPPDKWTNEFIATFFSYSFFKNYDQNSLKEFELFHKIDRDFYQPKYSTIADFNKVYMSMGVENYVWYHSNFYFLVEALYKCYGREFLHIYEEIFTKNSEKTFTTEDIIQLIDRDCSGEVKKWVNSIESKTNN